MKTPKEAVKSFCRYCMNSQVMSDCEKLDCILYDCAFGKGRVSIGVMRKWCLHCLGVPIKNGEGEIIGAIGVSGSTVENDHIVAMAGAEAVK